MSKASKNAYLILENGQTFRGKRIGADKEVISEIVFNTSMTGYTEVLTDPSYAGQAVVMTYPLIGSAGVCYDDMESDRPQADALIVHQLTECPSNFRCDVTLAEFLEKNGVPGIEGIDTRALTKAIREHGVMIGMITGDESLYDDPSKVIPRLKAYDAGDVVGKVTCREKYTLKGARTLEDNGIPAGKYTFDPEQYAKSLEGGPHEKAPAYEKSLSGAGLNIAMLDVGMKRNMARILCAKGCDVTVWPASSKAEDIIASRPDGIMISNGPGDPKACADIIPEIKKLYDSGIPMMAICLGHQLMALALGGDTRKMKYGHRGGNHPVKDLSNGRVYITSQNHGYVVDTDSIDPDIAVPAFTNVNDGTNEGLIYLHRSIFTVQFHPEACNGPKDSGYLYEKFLDAVKAAKR